MPEERRSRARRTRVKPRRSSKGDEIRYRVAREDELAPGESLKFILPIRGEDEECFLINFRGQFYAYVNRCRHVPMTMDWIENQFFAHDGRYLMCQTHNAYYDPTSGRCVAGPAPTCGKFLYRVPIEIEKGTIYARPLVGRFEDD